MFPKCASRGWGVEGGAPLALVLYTKPTPHISGNWELVCIYPYTGTYTTVKPFLLDSARARGVHQHHEHEPQAEHPGPAPA